jgi:hypothetical protein
VEECRNRPDRTHLMHPAIRVAQQRPAFGVVVSVVAMNYYVCILFFHTTTSQMRPVEQADDAKVARATESIRNSHLLRVENTKKFHPQRCCSSSERGVRDRSRNACVEESIA